MASGRAALAAGLLALAALAGCAQAAPEAVDVLREPAQDELRVLHDAEQILVRRCMEQAGFAYWPEPAPAPRRTFTYVLDDVDWARRDGYRSFRPQDTGTPDPNRSYAASLPADRRARAISTLSGPREGGKLRATMPNGLLVEHSDIGCDAESWRTLYRDQAAWFRVTTLTENFQGHRAGLVTGDARWTDGVRRWSDCMRDRGHDYDGPADLHAEFSGDARQLPRPDEITLAVAEAECAGDSGLGALAAELDRHYQAVMDAQYRPDLEEKRRLQNLALDRARAIVANP